MSIAQIIILVWFAFSAICSILAIGKERKPVTPGQGVVAVCTLSVLAFLVVIA